MIDKLLDLGLDDIKRGFIYQTDNQCYQCIICNAIFERGEMFSFHGRWFDAERAAKEHVETAHGGVIDILLEADKKYTSLTDKQRRLLKSFASGLSDKEIAKANNVAAATVRHQRFMFREKAKQAKMYLAIFESVESASKKDSSDQLIEAHSGAVSVDERYILTVEEDKKIIETYFINDEGMKLKLFPSKQKKKIAVLRKITSQFDPSLEYTEMEVNKILKNIYEDVSTIRRYLVQYGFLDRTADGSRYWIKK